MKCSVEGNFSKFRLGMDSIFVTEHFVPKLKSIHLFTPAYTCG